MKARYIFVVKRFQANALNIFDVNSKDKYGNKFTKGLLWSVAQKS